MSTLKAWELRQQLADYGDDVEVYIQASGEGEYEIGEVKPLPASGMAVIIAGDERE